MKITTSNQSQVASSSDETHQFKISANGTAFQILSSGLYSNKIGAVLRELGCNAMDAHVAAKKPKTPIHVMLPTLENLTLTIRDEGTGLSHEQVLSLYTTYFSSDKRNSNTFVGGLGLGSKSPFAYTTSFTVTSKHEGVARVYTCNIANDGAPTVTKLHEGKADGPAGMEVTMAVKREDLNNFNYQAQEVFRWFDVRPVFNVTLDFKESNATVLLETPGYNIVNIENYNRTQWIKMGNVAYPLHMQELELSKDTLWAGLLSSCALVLKAPIGHLQVAASREALQYDPTTKKNLTQLYQQAYNDIARRWLEVMQDSTHKNDWEQVAALMDWRTTYLPRTVSTDILKLLIQQHGVSAFHTRAVELLATPRALLAKDVSSANAYGIFWYEDGATGRKNIENGQYTVGRNTKAGFLRRTKDSCIVVADGKHINEKMQSWRTERKMPTVLLMSPTGKSSVAVTIQKANDIATAMGGVPVYRLSQMPCNTIVITPAIKRDYVEIEDRTVQVLDFFTGKITSIRLGDVPTTHKYMMLKDTTSTSKNSGDVYFETDATTKVFISAYELQCMPTCFQWMDHNKHAWVGPRGALMLRPVDVERLKLKDQGFEWYTTALCSAMIDPLNKDAIKCVAEAWPKDNSGWSRNLTEFSGGWVSDLADMLKHAPKNSVQTNNMWEALKDAKLDTLIQSKMNGTSAQEDQALHSYVNMVKTINKLTAGSKIKMPEARSAENMSKWFLDMYPLAQHVATKLFKDYVSSKSSSHDVVKILRVLLKLSV